MSAFEFLISFYGILLGLSVAELAGGFSRIWDRRATKGIGWLAPLLGLIVLADLVSFWTNTWSLRDLVQPSYLTAFGAAIINLMYYFAATQVFPRESSELSPDDHMLKHRKAIAVAAILSNLLMTVAYQLITAIDLPRLAKITLFNAPLFAMFVAIGWLRDRRAVLAVMLVGLPLTIFYEPAVGGLFDLFL